MTEDLNVFPNARSPLLGAGEDSIGIIDTPAVAGITSDITQTITDANSDVEKSATGSHAVRIAEEVIGTQTVNYTESKNIAIFTAKTESTSGFSNMNTTIRIRRDNISGVIIASGTLLGGSNTLTLVAVETDRPIANTTYVLTSGNANQEFAFNINTYTGFNGAVVVCNIEDNSIGIIVTPATATKQINAADSHTTHEQAVLPA